jgi:endonuclease-3
MKKLERQQAVLRILEETYHGMNTALNYKSPFELLVAVILSAQCTDERVNKITARLFPKYNTPRKMGKLTLEEMEGLIRDCGLYHAKAKNLLGTCHRLLEEFDGKVPETREELMSLPGAGRKTANVMLSVAFHQPALAVDTHVFRVSKRLGLAKGNDPLEVEQELLKAIPKEKWSEAHHWLIWHGRKICKARNPLCGECPLIDVCPSYKK